jgi:hypothetical protein
MGTWCDPLIWYLRDFSTAAVMTDAFVAACRPRKRRRAAALHVDLGAARWLKADRLWRGYTFRR